MAADAYLKVAAGQLQQAATDVKRQADQIRSEAASFKQKAEGDIVSKTAEVKVLQMEMDRRRDEPGVVSHLNIQIQNMQRDIDSLKQEIVQRTSQADQAVRGKEGAMQGLQSQSQQLAQQAGDPALR
jgi:peptidoglycan hydrolase CwlO-like protein